MMRCLALDLAARAGGKWIGEPPAGGIITGVGIDSREPLRGRAYIAIRGELHDGHAFVGEAVSQGAGVVVVDEAGMSHAAVEAVMGKAPILLVTDGRQALANLARRHRDELVAAGTQFIAITGSVGKTTTKHLLAEVLSSAWPVHAAPKSFNNEIGVPLTILGAAIADRVVIVEIGTNAPGEVAKLASIVRPQIAIITRVGRAHLEGLGGEEAVVREKLSLLESLEPGGFAVVNIDGPGVSAALAQLKAAPKAASNAAPCAEGGPCVTVGQDAAATVRVVSRGWDEERGTSWLRVTGGERFETVLAGVPGAVNALTTIVVAREMGLDDSRIRVALAGAGPPSMRFVREQIVACGAHVNVVNDAYNANPESLAAGLETFAETTRSASRRVVVIGDMLELGHAAPALHAAAGAQVGEMIKGNQIDGAWFVGPLSSAAWASCAAVAGNDRCSHVAEVGPELVDGLRAELVDRLALYLKASRGIRLERVLARLEAIAHETAASGEGGHAL